MKKINLIKRVIKCVLALGVILSAGSIYADSNENECSEEIIVSYFPETFVRQVLQENKVPQGSWDVIVEALKDKNGEVIRIVEEKSAAMTPNPLKDPEHRDKAIAIFREALLTTFSDALKKNGVKDDEQITIMLEQIQKKKAERFSKCLEKHMKAMQEMKTAPVQQNNKAEPAAK